MFNNIIGFGTQIFTAIVLLLSAGISAHMCYGFGTRKGREAFIGLILLLMVGTQVYHLIDASLYVPATRFYVYNSELHRTDCLESGKGMHFLFAPSSYCLFNSTTLSLCTAPLPAMSHVSLLVLCALFCTTMYCVLALHPRWQATF